MALRILLESVLAIFGKLGPALKVSVVPLLFLNVCLFILFANPGAGGLVTDDPNAPPIGLFPMLLLFLIIPLSLYVFSLIAVSWHRCVLRDEDVAIIPKMKDRPIWRYCGLSIVIWLIVLLAVFAVRLGLTLLIATTLGPESIGRLENILDFVVVMASHYFLFRMGLALVGTAVDKPMGVLEAWRATRSSKATVLGLAVLMAILNLLFTVALSVLPTLPDAIATVLDVTIGWTTIMVGISALTMFYSYRAEGRH